MTSIPPRVDPKVRGTKGNWLRSVLYSTASLIRQLWWLAPIGAMGLIFWVFYQGYFPLKGKDIAERGQFGDSFGVLNSLFTGLGFGGLVVTLLIQQRQLRHQESEIKLQRESEQTAHYEGTLHRLIELYSTTLSEVSSPKGNLRSRAVLRGSTARAFEAVKSERVHLIPLKMQERYNAKKLTPEDEVFLDYLYFRNFKILAFEIDRQGRLVETLKVLLRHLVYAVPPHVSIKPYCDLVGSQLTHVEISYFYLVALTFKDEGELRDLLLKSGLLERAAYVQRLRIHDYMYEQFWAVNVRSFKEPQLLPMNNKRIDAAVRAHRKRLGDKPDAGLKGYTSPRTRQNRGGDSASPS
ncbi:hypothetical protein [Diaphorobacter nitroreducens]|uniref:hypothetical protein n=1 Tax=Diaphorobacter nitroreducens TaxID=164759 RepID=UPI00289BC5C8|nr:hypothetical protein [Diaphorobacter nitroreducens]